MSTPTPRVAKVPSAETTQNSSSSSSLSPSTSTQVSGASTQKSTPSLNTSLSSSSPTPLTKFLKPLPPSLSTPRSSKVGKTGARVLTSSECLALLEEKEQKKRQEAEEKEKRKQERAEEKIEGGRNEA